MEISLPLPRRARGRAHGRRDGSRQPRPGPHARAWSGFGALTVDTLRARRLSIRLALAALLTLPLLGGGWLWLRGSSLVAVRHVHIVGVHGPDALEIRTALDGAARRMTTMNVSQSSLRAAVAGYPIVGALRVSASFPHTLNVYVSERPPVAVLVGTSERTAVAADGTVLGPALLSGSLPTVAGKLAPAPGARLSEATPLAAVAVLGAAPTQLRHFVARVYEGSEGLTLAMRNNLLVYFGDATRPHAKWLSLARVLSSPEAAGALYVDVRLPERPAAGFSLTAASTSAKTLAASQVGSANPAAATLAERLSRAVGSTRSPATGATESAGPKAEESEGEGTASARGEGESKGEASSASGGESEASVRPPGG
jgi:cell division protein FtsQ